VRAWVDTAGPRLRADADIVEILSRSNIDPRIPAIVFQTILRKQRHFRRNIYPEDARERSHGQIGRIFRAFALEAERIWKSEGFKALKDWLSLDKLVPLSDWFNAEGRVQGLLERNVGWRSLERNSHDWHERMASRRIDQYADENWNSPVGEMSVERIRVIPLSSRHALIEEGNRLHHCVASYDAECLSGEYRVFALEEPDGTRSTLGLRTEDGKRWTVDQHKGRYNGIVSAAAHKVGGLVAKLVTEAISHDD